MRYIQIFFSYILITSMSIILLLNQFPLRSYASEVIPDTKKAVAHSGTWTGYEFDYSLHGKYWTIADSSDMVTSTLNAPNFYFASEGILYKTSGYDFTVKLFLTELGIVLNPTKIPTVLGALWDIMSGQVIDNNYVQGAIYGTGGVFIGYALNDITGAYYSGSGTQTQFEIPNDYPDDLYNFYNYQLRDTVADYFTVIPPEDNFVKNHLEYSIPTDIETIKSNYNLCMEDYANIVSGSFYTEFDNSNYTFNRIWYQRNSYLSVGNSNTLYINKSIDSQWVKFCLNYGLNDQNKTLNYSDLIEDW